MPSLRREGAWRPGPRAVWCVRLSRLTSLVHRNLGMDMLASFSPEERTHFFKKSKASAVADRASGDHRAQDLPDSTESEDNVFTESKPIAVWKTLGYTEEQLTKCPSWVCPVLGPVVKVPIHQEHLRQIERAVAERVMEREQLQKQKKRKAPCQDTVCPEASEDDLDVPEPANGGGGESSKARGAPATKAPSEKKLAAQQAQASKFNQQQQGLARCCSCSKPGP